MMLIKQMSIVVFMLLLTALLPFFKPYHEPVKVIYSLLSSH